MSTPGYITNPEQPLPIAPAPAPPVVYVPASSRVGIWKIAAAVFLGNLICAVIGFVLTICLSFVIPLLATSVLRR